MKTFEIILPVRNPPAVLEKTIASLVEQSDRNFSVLLSDNHSNRGGEFINAAVASFQTAGISVRRIQPPAEMERVEHWNWAHHEATGDWVKPVFVGDWLSVDYVAKWRASISAHPECCFLHTSYVLHRQDQSDQTIASPCSGRFYPAAEMADAVIKQGISFGPPSAAAYDRLAYISMAGYSPCLPIRSDNFFFCTLAACYGVLGLAEPLCHFNAHGARFSTDLGKNRLAILRETVTCYALLSYYLWTENVTVSRWVFAKSLLRECRAGWRG